jgi:Zn-dependent protease
MSHLTPPFIIAMLIALTVHEWSHGMAAYLLGDSTAKYEGRLTLNPFTHLDILGTILFLTVGFGWAKPVPIDPRAFRHPKRDITLTALAGPASNLVLAFLTVGIATGTHALGVPGGNRFLEEFFQSMLFLNLGLMAFNLLPIAPLDGSKIVAMFVPFRYEAAYEEFLRNGPILLLFLLLAERLLNIPLIVWWISFIVSPVLRLMSVLL